MPLTLKEDSSSNLFENTSDCSARTRLKDIRSNYPHNILIGQLNINSLRNKFELMKDMIWDNIDVFMISETKIDESFLIDEFLIEGFHRPIRLDRDKNGGGILFYVRNNMTAVLLEKHNFPNDIEIIMIELNIRSMKWLIGCCYNPNRNLISYHLKELGKALDIYTKSYDNILMMGDFNVDFKDNNIIAFCNEFNLKNLNEEPTCFKSINNPSTIDLFLTNTRKCFQKIETIENDLSDFHKLLVTVMNVDLKRLPPKIICYREYKNFDAKNFENELLNHSHNRNICEKSFDDFKTSFLKILNKHAPLKKKYLRANHSTFITKEVRKEIMLRTKLKHQYLKKKTLESRNRYKRQRNFCVNLIKKAKRSFYKNLDISCLNDNRKFWKNIKPVFSNKVRSVDSINLKENEEFVENDEKIANIFNEYFVNIVPNLEIDIDSEYLCPTVDIVDPVDKAIKKYCNHPSINMINDKMSNTDYSFQFCSATSDKVLDLIQTLDKKKAIRLNDIPTKLIIEFKDLFCQYITQNFNKCLNTGNFPKDLKRAEVRPLYKKDGKCYKENYRPVSILSNLSKIYERYIYDQLQEYFDNFLSDNQCGFRKGFNTQHAILYMIEKMKKARDNKQVSSAILTDLSKAFDCVHHDLLIAKLNAYKVERKSLNFINEYLSDRWQKTKVGSSYSDALKVEYGVPQGSILGPLLFNIYICDFFFDQYNAEFASYADDTTPFNCRQTFDESLNDISITLEKMLKWFDNNYLKSNTSKCHLFLSPYENKSLDINGTKIESSNTEKLLGVTIDSNFSFKSHTEKICRKANQKLHALSRVGKFMDQSKKRILMKTFVMSNFNYCPLVWMCHGRTLNNRINQLHKRALKIVYNDHHSSFEELLEKDKSISVHQKNLQILVTEIYKVKNNISPKIMSKVFEFQENLNYNLRSGTNLVTRPSRTTNFGIETVSNLAPKIWALLPDEIKNASNLKIFKNKLKSWKPNECPCRLCKVYIKDVGYI